jgi:hypothetical protein
LNPETGAYEAVQVTVPLLEGITLQEVREVAGGEYEVYDTEGRLMLVNDGTGWVTAPMGLKLKDGIWYLWSSEELNWTAEWNVSDLDERIAEIGLLVDETLVHPENFRTGEMQCIAPELCFHMQVKPEMAHEAYLMLLDAFAHTTSPTLRQYWREIGFYGNTGQQLEKFLETSIGPDGQPFWLPAVSPQGTEFMYVQNTNGGTGNGRYRTNDLIDGLGGVRADRLYTAIISVEDWDKGIWARAWIQLIKTGNGRDTKNLLISQGEFNHWGLLVYPADGRLIFISEHHDTSLSLSNLDRTQVGGVLGVFRGDYDLLLMEKYIMAYYKNYTEKHFGGIKKFTDRYCPTISPGGVNCDEVVSSDDVIGLFEPQP